MKHLLFFSALALTPLAPCRASIPEQAVGQEQTARPHALDRVVVIGASMTDGFNLPHDMASVLDATIRREHQALEKSATIFFFANPLGTGPGEIELALDLDPSLVVGVDFLFWFGYGTVNRDGWAIVDESERLGLLDEGLLLIEELECAVVLGDFPDMSDAVGGMLLEEQMPELETLDALNRRLHAWAAERPNVGVIPLADTVEKLRSGDAFRIGRWEVEENSTDRMLQDDMLHPTIEGTAIIAHLVALACLEKGWASEADLELDVKKVLERLTGRAVSAPVPVQASSSD